MMMNSTQPTRTHPPSRAPLAGAEAKRVPSSGAGKTRRRNGRQGATQTAVAVTVTVDAASTATSQPLPSRVGRLTLASAWPLADGPALGW
jgi:hypothetical protein